MKKILPLILLLVLAGRAKSQTTTNTFPSNGNAGIGTTTPYAIGSYKVLDIVGNSQSNGGYLRLSTSNASGVARVFNTNDRLLFDVQVAGMYFQWRNAENLEVFRLNQDGSTRWSGNASSYTEVASNTYGQFIRQYANDGSTLSWLIKGYATADGVQAYFNNGGINANGRVRAREVVVDNSTTWPDYVFEEDYHLISLAELENYIKTNKHLPGIPNQAEVKEEGISLGEMNRKLLEKVEELTLHLIEQQKQVEALTKIVMHTKN